MSTRKPRGVIFVDLKPSKGSLNVRYPNYGISNPNQYGENGKVPYAASGKVAHPKSNSSIPANSLSSFRLIPKDSIEFANIANGNKEVTPVLPEILLTPCRYHNSGCKELVHCGTRSEQVHLECCDYRPIRCIMHTTCDQLVPYHTYIFHLAKHFLLPNYTSDLTSLVMLRCRDFEMPTFFSPKWISTNGHQFFLMLKRREDGIWVSWVWMFGTEPEAKTFRAKISYFRGKRFITGVIPVHSIRKPESVIEAKKNCVMFTDQTMQAVSGIRESLISDIYVNVQILVKSADSGPCPSPKLEIPEPEEMPADPKPEVEPVADPEIEIEPRIQLSLQQTIQAATLATFTAFFNRLKEAMMIAGVELATDAPEASQSLTFIPEAETLEELVQDTMVSAVVVSTEAEVASGKTANVEASSSGTHLHNTSGENLNAATTTDANAESVEAAILDSDSIEGQIDEAAENETSVFGSTFTNAYMSDLGSTVGDLFDRITTRLNDLRLHLYDSLENTFGSSGDVAAEEVPTPDADVPLNTEVPSNTQLYGRRRFSDMLADFEQNLEVD